MSTSSPQPDAKQLVDQLRQQMEAFVGSRRAGRQYSGLRSCELEESAPGNPTGQNCFSTGVLALDRLLPGGGLRRGTLVEWLGEGGGSLLAILAAREALTMDAKRSLVVVESTSTAARLAPAAVDAWGLSLASTVWLRVDRRKDQWWAVDQALRSPAVASVLVWPDARGHGETCDDRMFRRWQLAAESSGAVGMVIRSAAARNEPSWADVRWLVHACKTFDAPSRGASAVSQHGPRWQLDVECLCNGYVGSSRRVTCEITSELPVRSESS